MECMFPQFLPSPFINNAAVTPLQTLQQYSPAVENSGTPAVITRDLVRAFGQKTAANHLNLTVQREFHRRANQEP